MLIHELLPVFILSFDRLALLRPGLFHLRVSAVEMICKSLTPFQRDRNGNHGSLVLREWSDHIVVFRDQRVVARVDERDPIIEGWYRR
jgi:hypothetical protein